MQGPRISDDAWIHDVLIEDTDEGFDITIAVGTEEKPDVPIAEAKQDVYTRLGARPDAVVRVAMEQPSTRKILARTGEVPGYGWAAFEPAPLAHPVEVGETDGSVMVTNGLVRVDVDTADGHLRAGRHARLRPAGGRRRPRRLVQLLAAAPGLLRRRAPRGHRPGRRARAGPGARAHHEHLRLARSRGRFHPGARRRAPGGRPHRRGGAGGRRHGARRDQLRQPERRPPPPRPPAAPRTGAALPGRERLHRGQAGPDGRRPARRVRAAHRARQPLRQRRAPHGRPRRRVRVRADRHRGRRGAHHGADRPALDRHAVPARHGLPPLSCRPAHARWRASRCGASGSSCATRWRSTAKTRTGWPTTSCSRWSPS